MREVLIIYHGVGMAGKTTNLDGLKNIFEHYVIDRFHTQTVENRTVFLDTLLLAINIKNLDQKLKVRVMSTPGQERFAILRQWIINHGDGFVFVYDPTVNHEDNIQAFKEIYSPNIKLIVQINKTDLVDKNLVDKVRNLFESKGFQVIEASAVNNIGVKETFQTILKEILS
jgi:signal recognition particle receptor subunit beta